PPAVVLVKEGEFEFAALGVVEDGAAAVAAIGLAVLSLRLLDQFDALLLQSLEQLVELIGVGGVVGQVLVDLREGQVALALAGLDERLEAVVPFQLHADLLACAAA